MTSVALRYDTACCIVGAVVLAVLLTGFFFLNGSETRARIIRISGDVSIERDGLSLAPITGRVLHSSDSIITGEGSFVEIAYDRSLKNVVRIGADAHVVLENDVVTKKTTIFIDKGDLLLKLNGLKKGSTFQVRTPIAIAGVRGTCFGVALQGKEAVITDFDSRIFVKGISEDSTEMDHELLLRGGWKVIVKQFEKSFRFEQITPAERGAWLLWKDQIDAMPREPVFNSSCLINFIAVMAAFLARCSLAMASTVGSLAWPVLVLIFVAYAGITVNLRKVLA